MVAKNWICLGALFAAAAVLLGAYSAHGLKKKLDASGYSAEEIDLRVTERWDPAVRYQMYHAIGLILLGILQGSRCSKCSKISGTAFCLGIVLFSGLLYVMTFSVPSLKWLGMIVPIGGVSFVVGWIALGVSGSQREFPLE